MRRITKISISVFLVLLVLTGICSATVFTFTTERHKFHTNSKGTTANPNAPINLDVLTASGWTAIVPPGTYNTDGAGNFDFSLPNQYSGVAGILGKTVRVTVAGNSGTTTVVKKMSWWEHILNCLSSSPAPGENIDPVRSYLVQTYENSSLEQNDKDKVVAELNNLPDKVPVDGITPEDIPFTVEMAYYLTDIGEPPLTTCIVCPVCSICLHNLGPDYQDVLLGGTATYDIMVTNLNSTSDTIQLTYENIFESGSCSWTVDLSKNSVTLDPYASEDITLSVSAASDCDPSSRKKVKVTGTSQNGLNVGKTITASVTKEMHVIPEFTTIAIPVAAVLGLLFLFSRRKRKE